MYLIIFEGFEMKAKTKKSIQTWFKRNKIKVSIDWVKLREMGEVVSSCDRWYICKIDGRQYLDVEWIKKYGWFEWPGKVYRIITSYERKHGF